MSPKFRRSAVRIASQGVGESGVQPRRLASILTAGALALALVLGAAIPAKADRKDDLAKALIAARAGEIKARALGMRDLDRRGAAVGQPLFRELSSTRRVRPPPAPRLRQ